MQRAARLCTSWEQLVLETKQIIYYDLHCMHAGLEHPILAVLQNVKYLALRFQASSVKYLGTGGSND